jgi:hypothetical protein
MTTLGFAAAAWTSVQLIKEKHRQTNVAEIFAIRPCSKENEGFDFTRLLRNNNYHSDADLAEGLFLNEKLLTRDCCLGVQTQIAACVRSIASLRSNDSTGSGRPDYSVLSGNSPGEWGCKCRRKGACALSDVKYALVD